MHICFVLLLYLFCSENTEKHNDKASERNSEYTLDQLDSYMQREQVFSNRNNVIDWLLGLNITNKLPGKNDDNPNQISNKTISNNPNQTSSYTKNKLRSHICNRIVNNKNSPTKDKFNTPNGIKTKQALEKLKEKNLKELLNDKNAFFETKNYVFKVKTPRNEPLPRDLGVSNSEKHPTTVSSNHAQSNKNNFSSINRVREKYTSQTQFDQSFLTFLDDKKILNFTNFYMSNKDRHISSENYSKILVQINSSDQSHKNAFLYFKLHEIIKMLSPLDFHTTQSSIKLLLKENLVFKDVIIEDCHLNGNEQYTNNDLDNFISFDPNKESLFNKLSFTYNKYLSDIAKADQTEHIYYFYNFLIGEVLYKPNNYEFYVLDSKLWKIQLFMPEFYFNIIWTLQMFKKMPHNKELVEFMSMEVHHLFQLIREFYGLHLDNYNKKKCAEQIYKSVYDYRKFTLKKIQFLTPNNPKKCLYLYALSQYIGYYIHSSTNSAVNLLFLITFTSSSKEFSEISQNWICKNNNTRFTISIYELIYTNLLQKMQYKKELISILYFSLIFLTMCKEGIGQFDLNRITFFNYKDFTIMLSYNEGSGQIFANFLFNEQIVYYFNNALNIIFKE